MNIKKELTNYYLDNYTTKYKDQIHDILDILSEYDNKLTDLDGVDKFIIKRLLKDEKLLVKVDSIDTRHEMNID